MKPLLIRALVAPVSQISSPTSTPVAVLRALLPTEASAQPSATLE